MTARLAPDGRDPQRVPDNWRELVDPAEWRLNAEGLPARRAARVIVLRLEPEPGILLVTGHDFAAPSKRWAFTPGGGIEAGETPQQAAARELAEEAGWQVDPGVLVGPVALRSSLFHFELLTCRQEESLFLLHTRGGQADLDPSGWTALEQEVLESLRWWSLSELDAAAQAGMTIFPPSLPGLARELLGGWDGRVRKIREE